MKGNKPVEAAQEPVRLDADLFTRRHRHTVWGAAAFLLLLVFSVAWLTWKLGPEGYAAFFATVQPWLLGWKAVMLATLIVFWEPIWRWVGRYYGLGLLEPELIRALRPTFVIIVVLNETLQLLLHKT